jgi:hypothetical protein
MYIRELALAIKNLDKFYRGKLLERLLIQEIISEILKQE